MNDRIHKFHIERLRAATLDKLSTEHIPEWLCKNTSLGGKPFNFTNHEYQERILRDTSSDLVIRKCAQVGLSELSARLSLALVGMVPFYTIIYTLPTATFASVFMNTRVNPIIQSSQFLKDAINTTTDNNEVKQFGSSYLYLKGSSSGNAAISVPASCIISDETCFSDQIILSQYQSRLRHTTNPRHIQLSTPTAPGYAIDEAFTNSRRHFNLVRCEHCNHVFLPDYYKHVRIPGYDDDLRAITANNLARIRWREAHTFCPCCQKMPSLQPAHREWVCENPEENYEAVGYQVSPFDAPNIMTVPKLVLESTKYLKKTDFDNFGLGLPAEDRESTITSEDLDAIMLPSQKAGGPTVMGLDMGMICHAVIMAPQPDGTKIITHTEKIPLGNVRKRRRELAKQFRVRLTVVDSLPYTETVLNMQTEDRNLFGAFYVTTKSLETHRVIDKEEDDKEAQLEVRQVNINRNQCFDIVMDEIRSKTILKVSDENDAEWKLHCRDMKRVQQYNNENQMTYVWVKSVKGEDHFHHATLYAYVASQMLGASRNTVLLPTLPMKFKVKTDV